VGFVANRVSVVQRGCSHCAFIIHLKYVLILSSQLSLDLSSDLFPTGFCTKNQYAFFSPPYELYSPTMSPPIWSSEYFVWCINHEPRHYIILTWSFKKLDWKAWNGQILLGIVANGGLLRTQQWTFWFYKIQEICILDEKFYDSNKGPAACSWLLWICMLLGKNRLDGLDSVLLHT
jgi:hypothetical protein